MKKNAKKGFAWAQHLLGQSFYHGDGVTISHYDAVGFEKLPLRATLWRIIV